MTARLAVVVLQHGRWRDTIACLQSLVPAVTAGHARVFLVDNASPDDSLDRVHRWIDGAWREIPSPVHDTVAAHWWPLNGADSERWHITGVAQPVLPAGAAFVSCPLTCNAGFAAGMNHGIRLALSDPHVAAVWLLNNDTVVAPDTVESLLGALDETPADIAQFGMTVCYYDRPTIVQSVGWCRWNPWLATSKRLHDGASAHQGLSRVPTRPGYVYGASWVLRATALRSVGLLSEEGFLYGEELDWSCRAASAGWQTALVAKAVIWHREGATVGAGLRNVEARGELPDLAGISARLRLTRRFFPRMLPTVYLSVLGAALNRLRRGDSRRALAVARLVLAGGVPAPRPRTEVDPSSCSQS